MQADVAVQTSFGVGLYSKEMSQRSYLQLEHLAEVELASGHSVLIDASFGTATGRARFSKLAASSHARFVILFVQCDPDEQRRRLYERTRLGTSISDGRAELLDEQESVFEVPDDTEGDIITVLTSMSPEEAVNSIYKRLLRS